MQLNEEKIPAQEQQEIILNLFYSSAMKDNPKRNKNLS